MYNIQNIFIMPKGGSRIGAGRPRGQGKYGVETYPVRLPKNMIPEILNYVEAKGYKLPLFASKVFAGFPSVVDDYVESQIDLNRYLIKHPSATFLLRVSGDSMINAGISNGDILIVDRSIEAVHDRIVIAAIDNELTVKRLYNKDGVIMLMPENKKYQPIKIKESNEIIIWGVVTNVIKSF
jgi:DNA polymerase V